MNRESVLPGRCLDDDADGSQRQQHDSLLQPRRSRPGVHQHHVFGSGDAVDFGGQGAVQQYGPYQPFNPLSILDGSQVNGTYRLTIHDSAKNNTGTLVNWSITVDSDAPEFVLQDGAAEDQNADATSDENPLTTPFTGLTPGDIYAVPAPEPPTPVTFGPDPLSIFRSVESEFGAADCSWPADRKQPGRGHNGNSQQR